MQRLTAKHGQEFGKLTFLKDLGSRKYGQEKGRPKWSVFWLMQCVCGAKKELRASAVVQKRVQTCGCMVRTRVSPSRLPAGVAMANYWFNSYLNNAKKRELSFDLTREEFYLLTSANCAYCGAAPSHVVQIKYSSRSKQTPGQYRARTPYICNGIDRVDNDKGYSVSNCVPSCHECNQAKKSRSAEDFLSHVKRVTLFQIKNPVSKWAQNAAHMLPASAERGENG